MKELGIEIIKAIKNIVVELWFSIVHFREPN